jgi:hypothetical protein
MSSSADSRWANYQPSEELSTFLNDTAGNTWVYSYNCGVEAESAGRSPNKGIMTLRHDLGALPFLLAGRNDIVLAPPQRPEFLHSLQQIGFTDLPEFCCSLSDLSADRTDQITGYRPFGVPGSHICRSNVARVRNDVAVCRTIIEIQLAVEKFGPKVVIKSEFSSSGQGVRWRWDGATEGWANNRLKQDGVVTVEPFMDIITELSGEFLLGMWNGVSTVVVEHGMWRGQWLGEELKQMSQEVYDFVFVQRQVRFCVYAFLFTLIYPIYTLFIPYVY